MSLYYNPVKTRGIYNPHSSEPFRLSRSRIDTFLNCQRCFYLDRRLGTDRPPGFPFSLNNAVDKLLKKEFDIHRAKNTAHPLMASYGIDAVPFSHARMEEWRDAIKRGITFSHAATNLLVTGGVDDVWVNSNGELHVVDYKATSKDTEVTLDADWQIGYKRQVEMYQWLFRKNNFKVSNTAYFVYCNGDADKEAFDGKLEFDVKIIPYEGSDHWIEPTLLKIKECLTNDAIPEAAYDCDYCRYRKAAAAHELKEERAAMAEVSKVKIQGLGI